MMNSKFYKALPPPIRYLEKWKFCIWHCPVFSESNRTELPQTPKIISGSNIQKDVIFLVLINNCVVLSVKVHNVLFVLNGELKLALHL